MHQRCGQYWPLTRYACIGVSFRCFKLFMYISILLMVQSCNVIDHLGVLNFLCIFQYSSWCNHVMWLIGNSLPCCHGDQVVTGVPLHVTVATWWSCQSGTQPTRIHTCNSRAWTCIWFHNTNTIWIPQLCCVKSFKSFYVGQNPSPILVIFSAPEGLLFRAGINVNPC